MKTTDESVPPVAIRCQARHHRQGSLGVWLLAMVVVGGVSGGLGYALGARQGSTRVETLGDRSAFVAPKEYYQTTASFSEIEIAKGELSALAARYLAEMESRFGQLHGPSSVVLDTGRPEATEATMRVIAGLRAGAEEFAGTAQYPVLLQHLMVVLKRSGRLEDWVEVYLDMAYRHPTEPLVGRLAPQAIRHGIAVGREREISHVLRQIGRMPILFDAKTRVQSVVGTGDEGDAGLDPFQESL